MLLAIDIGNSHTVCGVYDGPRLVAEWRTTTHDHRTEDQVGLQVRSFLRDKGLEPRSITRIGISSVVPPMTESYERMSRSSFGLEPVVIHGELFLGFKILYENALAVGADRLCNAAAGFAKFGGPLIIVDFGTATTYDIIARNGDYLGGVIAPGVETTAADLHRRAAKLPRVDLHLPSSLIGRDTASSMQSGILYGAIDAAEGMVRRLKSTVTADQGSEPKVIGTGGFSSFMSEHSTVLDHVEPSLVLEGIRLLCDRLQSGRK